MTQKLDPKGVTNLYSALCDTTVDSLEKTVKPLTPKKKFEIYQEQNKKSTRDESNYVIEEYQAYAARMHYDILQQSTGQAYKTHLVKLNQKPSTIIRKLSAVRVYLKTGHGVI